MNQYLGCVLLQFGLVHISAGDLLRAEVAAGTPEGKEAASYMDSGNLVPNSVVVEMVTNRLSQPDVQEHGWLLDGYPRSGDQAEAIVQKGIKPDLFVLISVSVFALLSCIAPMLLHLSIFITRTDAVPYVQQCAGDEGIAVHSTAVIACKLQQMQCHIRQYASRLDYVSVCFQMSECTCTLHDACVQDGNGWADWILQYAANAMQVPDDDLVDRVAGRRLDPETGDIYHLKHKPPPKDITHRLIQRSDDTAEKVKTRLNNHHSNVDAVLEYYQDVFVEVSVVYVSAHTHTHTSSEACLVHETYK